MPSAHWHSGQMGQPCSPWWCQKTGHLFSLSQWDVAPTCPLTPTHSHPWHFPLSSSLSASHTLLSGKELMSSVPLSCKWWCRKMEKMNRVPWHYVPRDTCTMSFIVFYMSLGETTARPSHQPQYKIMTGIMQVSWHMKASLSTNKTHFLLREAPWSSQSPWWQEVSLEGLPIKLTQFISYEP